MRASGPASQLAMHCFHMLHEVKPHHLRMLVQASCAPPCNCWWVQACPMDLTRANSSKHLTSAAIHRKAAVQRSDQKPQCETRQMRGVERTSLSWMQYWMLMRPTTLSALASLVVQSRMVSKHSAGIVCGGMLHAESPAWCTHPPLNTLLSSYRPLTTSTSFNTLVFRWSLEYPDGL